jgi:hypothetical protein
VQEPEKLPKLSYMETERDDKMLKVNIKGLSLCLTKHYAMKTYWGVEI